MNESNLINQEMITIRAGPRMRAALVLAVIADLVQVLIFPMFLEGAGSPADDVLDVCLAGIFGLLLGWHWEFVPSFAGKLIPGVDLVPLWTLAVANVYRKSRRLVVPKEQSAEGSRKKSDERDF